jgi:hypothetical protein
MALEKSGAIFILSLYLLHNMELFEDFNRHETIMGQLFKKWKLIVKTIKPMWYYV